MPVRTSEAVWEGNLLKGKGKMKMGSGAYEGGYSFSSRFENGPGTNPEELIGAAHAGCFSMALSAELQKAGCTAESAMLKQPACAADTISTTATVTLENHPQTSWTVTRIHLETTAKVPKITPEKFA